MIETSSQAADDPQARAHALLGLALADEDPASDDLESRAGDQIGHYTLIEKLGEGGFGIVWRAQQTAPLKREVALKIIRPGMDSKTVIARFHTEKLAMARMAHPNIAMVLEAGATPQGRPFFAMEVVQGQSITEYAQAKSLTLRARVELFIDVCLAVQHAHQRGVIHRDLKPSNILVTELDGKPVPKIIDFGIAKALSTDMQGFATRAFTSQGLLLGTPQYMAPEHSLLGSDEVDVRADVFSLGAILYELLTGDTPLSRDASKTDSMHRLMQRICEEEPLRPSTSILRAGKASEVEAKQMVKALREELDWVVLKALEKQPDLRYPSVTALSDDLQNYLRDLPVSVGPPSARYQFRKWTQRHRTAFTVGTVVVTLLTASSIVISMAYVDESKARQIAEHLRLRSEASEQMAHSEVRKSETLIAFLTDLLDRAAEHVDEGRNAEVLRLALGESAGHIDDFSDQPELQAQLYRRLADIYSAMDEPKAALPLFQKAWQTQVKRSGEQDINSLLLLYEVARTQSRAAMREEAIATYNQVSKSLEALGKARSDEWFESRRRIAMEMIDLGRTQEARAVLRDLETRRNGSGQIGHENNNFLRAMAELHWLLGEFDEAETLLEQSLAQLGKPHLQRSRAATLRAYSKLEVQRGNLAQAAQRLEDGILAEIAADGPANHQLINRWIEVARLYARVGRFEDAATATQSARGLAQQRGHLSQQIHAIQASAEIHDQAGQLEQALLFRRECEPLAAQVTSDRRPWLEQWRAITDLQTRLGQVEPAEKSALTLWRIMLLNEQREVKTDPEFARVLYNTLIAACQPVRSTRGDLLDQWTRRRDELTAARVP